MKKLYKLLIVIVFTFFVGMLSVSAEQLRAVRLDSKKTSVGEKMSISLSYNDYSSETESYSSKLHFYAPNAPEVVKTIKGYYTSFDISDDFLPNNYYSLSYLEIIDKNGNVTKYSPFESGEYIMVNCDYCTFYVNERGPIKNFKIYSDGYKRKNNNDFYLKNDKVHFKIESNFAISSAKMTIGSYRDSNKHVYELKALANDIYEIDLSKDSSLKYNSYSPAELQIVANGKEYIYNNDYNNYKSYALSYGGSMSIYYDMLNGLTIEKETAALNEKVYLNLSLNDKALSGEVKFKGEKGQFTTSIRDIDTKPYIVIPYTAKLGDYELEYISIFGNNYNEQYYYASSTTKYTYSSKDEYLGNNGFATIYDKRDYKNKLTVVKDETTIIGELLELDNALITDDIIKDIKNVKDGIIINVDASDNPVVRSELFETIKGHDKTLNIKYKDFCWTFNGKDITEVKKLKANFVVASFKKYEEITKAVKNGALVVFANYGSLPGKATIKFNFTEELAKEVNGNKFNLYMYDSTDTQKFELIDTGIKQNKEGFYEIELNNTSSYYVVTPDEIASRYLIGYDFPWLLVIIIALSSIIVIGIIVLVILKIRKGKKKKEDKPVESTEVVEEPTSETPTVEEDNKNEEII